MTELRHGYTLAGLARLARLAVHTAGTMASDWHDRYETAWSAIAEHLYAAEHWPPRHDLVRVGQLAIYAAVDDGRHHHGYYKRKTIGTEAGAGSSPAFAAYWRPFAAPVPSPESRIVERISLAQILPMLAPAQREAIVALAACGSYADAARAIGATGVTFKSNLSRGRQRFLAWWHEGEAPSKPWGCDRRAGKTADTRRAGGSRAALAAIRRRGRARDIRGAS